MPESAGLAGPGEEGQRHHRAGREFGKHRAHHALTPVFSEGELNVCGSSGFPNGPTGMPAKHADTGALDRGAYPEHSNRSM